MTPYDSIHHHLRIDHANRPQAMPQGSIDGVMSRALYAMVNHIDRLITRRG